MSSDPGRRTGLSPRTTRARRVSLCAAALVVVLSLATACGAGTNSSERGADRLADSMDSTTTSTSSSSTSSTSTTTTAAPAASSPSARERLAVLAIDDRPSPQGVYRREDWPHWADVDGNGCDARQDALIAWSIVTPTVNRSGTCRVITGSWVSPYDRVSSNNPSDFDVDHLVPLENAFVSGGWQWTAERRRAFSNDQAELVVASAHSNRSKGSSPPNEWRPDDRDSWCAYADGWIAVKSAWGLTATTAERDALGQMLDTCGLAGAVWPRGDGAALNAPDPSVSGGASGGATPPPASNGSGDAYYANCSAARAAGAAPLHRGDPGYRSSLDRDGDGLACE